MENVIRDLKERSGKSTKVRVEAVREVAVGAAIHFVIFLSCAVGRFAIIMSSEDKDKMKISAGKSFFVKNLRHISSISSVPIFQPTSSTTIKSSKRASETMNASFTDEEISSILDQLDIGNLLRIGHPQEKTAPQQAAQSSGTVVPLPDFVRNPSSINENHFVEVRTSLSLSLSLSLFLSLSLSYLKSLSDACPWG